jgi:hypothetical protein
MKIKKSMSRTRHLPVSKILLHAGLIVFVALLIIPSKRLLAQTTKVIYFMAGPKDHAYPGRHETKKDLLVLQHCLDSVTNIHGVKIVTRFIYDRTEHDINDMKDAAAIVIESSSESSSKTQTHPLFPPSSDERGYDPEITRYLDQVDSLHKQGMGIVILHWAVAANNRKARRLYTEWFGGGWMPHYSMNPLGIWSVTPIKAAKDHPILRGVGPWTYKDEIFSKFMVIPEDPHRTDLLMGEAPKTNQGPVATRCLTWAYENGKERGLIWGGMDYHAALLNDNYRRFLLNAIIWAAGIIVPKGGVESSAKQLQLTPPITDRFDHM